jgi:hypothetical protein
MARQPAVRQPRDRFVSNDLAGRSRSPTPGCLGSVKGTFKPPNFPGLFVPAKRSSAGRQPDHHPVRLRVHVIRMQLISSCAYALAAAKTEGEASRATVVALSPSKDRRRVVLRARTLRVGPTAATRALCSSSRLSKFTFLPANRGGQLRDHGGSVSRPPPRSRDRRIANVSVDRSQI